MMDRIIGCLVGLAIGDTLGAPLEFLTRREVRRRFPGGLRDMIASPRWEQGEYTDDTSMALLIASSLVANGRFVAVDVADRFQIWATTSKDVGIQTRAVMNMPDYVENPEACAAAYFRDHPHSSAGNGAVMRCAPVALFYLNSLEELVATSRASARLTHYDPRAQASCVILNVLIRAAILEGIRDGRQQAISAVDPGERKDWVRLEHIEMYEEEDISSSGYTVDTLEAAAWAFLTTESFEEAVVRAANLGHDADTVAAVCGSLAGAFYGYTHVPARWKNKLKDEAKIRAIALALGREHRGI